MTRLRRKLALLLAMSVVGSNTGVAFAKDYTDHWASKTITKWSDKGLLKGYEDGTFKPDNAITRAEFAVILVRMFGYNQIEQSIIFEDVKKDAWYTEAISAVTSAGIMYVDSNQFRPSDAITREEATFALAKAYSITGEDEEVEFTDEASISEWASIQVEAMHTKGFVEGNEAGAFEPHRSLTRAEFLTMADRMTSEIISVPGTYSENIAGNLIVNTRDVVLKDMVIEGNLYLGEGIGDGEVYLEGIEVKGQVYVDGGGENSIKSKYSKFYDKIVVSAENPVRVVIEGDAVKVEAMSDTEIILTGNFEDVIVAPNVNMTIKEAVVDKIIVAPGSAESKPSTIVVDKTSKVDMVQADSGVNIEGEGAVKTLLVNSEGVNIERLPENVIIKDDDITFNLGGEVVNKDEVEEMIKPNTGGSSSGGGSSGGGSGGNTKPPIQEKYRISGTVSYEGENVEYAKVNVFKFTEGGDYTHVENTLTDKNGYYSFYVDSDEMYWVEAWINDDEGYGYHTSYDGEDHKGIYVIEDKDINLELQKKHVANFKVTDKNGVAVNYIAIDVYLNGKYRQTAQTNDFGENTIYMWDENGDYTFKLNYNGELIYEDPTVYKVSETFKLDIPIKLEEVGLNNIVQGRIIDEKTKQPVEGVNVRLFKVSVTGPSGNHHTPICTVVTDKEGNYTFSIDDLESIYVVSGEVDKLDETGEMSRYETVGVDPRFIDINNNSLQLSQCRGATIKVVDKNGKAVKDIKVGIESGNNGYSTTYTDTKGEGLLYGIWIEPGKYIVWAEMEVDGKLQRQMNALDIIEGKYNYYHTFEFDIEDNNRLAEITVKNPEVKVGDKTVEAYRVDIQSARGSEQGWGISSILHNGVAVISIPEDFKGERVELRVLNKQGISLYEEEIDFIGSELKETIDLSEVPKSDINIEFDTTAIPDIEIKDDINVTVDMTGWWNELNAMTVDQVSTRGENVVFENLIKSNYNIRAEYTTQGMLYLSTIHIHPDSFERGDMSFCMNFVPATEFTIEFKDVNGNNLTNKSIAIQLQNDTGINGFVPYVTDEFGKVNVVEGIKEGAEIYIEIPSSNGEGYKIIDNQSIKPDKGGKYTVTVEIERW